MGNKYTKDLPCVMTDDEKRLKGSAIAAAVSEKAELEAEKKEFGEDIKKRMGAVEKRISALAHELSTGKEVRAVECAEYEKYATRMVDLVRLDTGEVIFSRPMRPDELQTSMEMRAEGEDAH